MEDFEDNMKDTEDTGLLDTEEYNDLIFSIKSLIFHR